MSRLDLEVFFFGTAILKLLPSGRQGRLIVSAKNTNRLQKSIHQSLFLILKSLRAANFPPIT
jgi:hypothetical protein